MLNYLYFLKKYFLALIRRRGPRSRFVSWRQGDACGRLFRYYLKKNIRLNAIMYDMIASKLFLH